MVKIKKEKSIRLLPDGKPSPLDFDTFYPWACVEFELPIIPIIHRSMQDKNMPLKAGVKPSSQSSNDSSSDSSQPTYTRTDNILQAVYDWQNNLIEINMNRTTLHAMLFNVLVICLPYHHKMCKMTLKGNGLTSQMVHNLTHVLQNSHITSIHISDTHVPEQNFYELVQMFSNLSQLLLCMCSINDDSLKLIMEHCKTNGVLNILDLTTNNITDVGASYISDMLRVNRSLHYFSLADNQISDVGCFEILRVLVPFYLTADEIRTVRWSNFKCFSYGMAAYVDETVTQNRTKPPSQTLKREKRQKREKSEYRGQSALKATSKKAMPDEPKPTPDELKIKVNYPDDFSFKETISRNAHVYSVGNRSLYRLNMAYNQIEYPVLLRTLEVFNKQMELGDKCEKGGLSHVLLDGNNLPVGGTKLPVGTRRAGGGLPVQRRGPLNKTSTAHYQASLPSIALVKPI